MTTRRIAAVLLLLLAGPGLALEPGEMECASANGEVIDWTIAWAAPLNGGMAFRISAAAEKSFTTLPCIANIGPVPIWTSQPDEVLIHCEDARGLITYHEGASQWSHAWGVFIWRETGSVGEVLISTAGCVVHNISSNGRSR